MIKIVGGIVVYETEDIARELGVSVLTARAWIREGKLKGKKIGRGWVVTEDSLRAFIAGEEGSRGPRAAHMEVKDAAATPDDTPPAPDGEGG